MDRVSFPAIIFDHVCQLNDVLPFFILLTGLKCMLVFPSKRGLTTFAVDVGHRMQAGQKYALLCRATPNVHH